MIEIPTDPCPASIILDQIIKKEGCTQKPHLFYESTGAKIAENELVPSESRLEYNVIAPAATTTTPGGYPGGP